jgi:hypothetical protein
MWVDGFRHEVDLFHLTEENLRGRIGYDDSNGR